MKLVKYGVTLKRLREEDIELVRNWRNSENIRNKMEYREYITPEMQQKWFKEIDTTDNFFYIIIYKDEKVGLLSEKKIEFGGKGKTESGLFFSDTKYLNSYLPVFVSLILLESSFYFHEGNESYIRVLKDNESAISYNKSLGYELCPNQEDVYNQKYVLTKEKFLEKSKKLRKAALHLSGGDNKMYLYLDKEDFEKGIGQHYEKLINESNMEVEMMEAKEEYEKIYFLDFDKLK
jgi:UDP-4-amino-4,6-dideoxy-N-acetyl-beta-L-altrosamine N-acetyltransferase